MRYREFLNKLIVVAAIGGQLLTVPIIAKAQSGGFTITPLVKRGDPSPDGGRFFGCSDCGGVILGFRGFNNVGQVTLSADTEGRCFDADFLVSATGSVVLADLCRQTSLGKFSFLGRINVNDEGQAAMEAGPVVGGRIIPMLVVSSGGELTKIVEEGDPIPGGEAVFKGCGFSEPSINNKGEIAFAACAEDGEGRGHDAVFIVSHGEVRTVAGGDDTTPIGGTFNFNFIPKFPVWVNNNGDVLFQAGAMLSLIEERVGLFLSTKDGIEKIEVDGDPMPDGSIVTPHRFGFGSLNNEGEVAFTVALTGGKGDTGIFLYSAGRIEKVMRASEVTPIGGKFLSLGGSTFTPPRINNNGAIAFNARVKNGSTSAGVFLASPRA
jgi:hypothetical protein